MTSETEALKHYHARYNNETYRAAQTALVRDFWGIPADERSLENVLRAEPIHSLLNLLTDTCLEICGHPLMQGRRDRLICALADGWVSADTIRLMARHMANFEGSGGFFGADFEHAMLALLKIQSLNVHAAIQTASLLHSASGNAAHELLCAADALLQLAGLLLKGETSEAYKLEKLHKAERYLAYAREHLDLPATKAFVPYRTLLLSGDKTYAGMVIGHEASGSLLVKWYKWGFTSSDVIRDWIAPGLVDDLTVLDEGECVKRFGGLPAEYGK